MTKTATIDTYHVRGSDEKHGPLYKGASRDGIVGAIIHRKYSTRIGPYRAEAGTVCSG